MKNKWNESRKVTVPPEVLATMYASGKTVAEIAAEFFVSVQPIKRILKEAGVQLRKAARRDGKGRGKDNPAWRGGRRKRKDGYIIVWTPRGDRLEHRVIMERILGRELLKTEVVHHKDGNPSNNDPINLEVIGGQSVHALHHAKHNREALLHNGLKQCTLCFLVKPLSDFHKTRSNKMGIQSWCKKCKNERDSERRRKKNR